MRIVLAAVWVVFFLMAPSVARAQEVIAQNTVEFSLEGGHESEPHSEFRAQVPVWKTEHLAFDLRISWGSVFGPRAFGLIGYKTETEKVAVDVSSGLGVAENAKSPYGVVTASAVWHHKLSLSTEVEMGRVSVHHEEETDIWARSSIRYKVLPLMEVGILHQHHEEDFVGALGTVALGHRHHAPKVWGAVSPKGQVEAGLTFVW